jgi:tetratricopeptide (TPR) repeat protein
MKMRKRMYPIVLCLLLVACASVPVRTPNPTNPGITLPEKSFIEDIKINYGQAFTDCVPVSLEAVYKFYGVNVNRKEIADQIQLFSGTKIKDMVSFVKSKNCDIDPFVDENEDKRRIKYHLSQRFPVLVTVGNVRIHHMVVLVGYDDNKRIFYVADPGWRKLQEWRYIDFNEWHEYPGNWGYLVYPQSMDNQIIAYYTKVIESNPKLESAYYNRGNVYNQKELYDQAISDYNKALEINPSYGKAYNNLAWMLATAKASGFRDGKRAVELALKACELSGWENPGYLDTLAAAYARVGDFRNAVKWQEKAMESSEMAKQAGVQERLKLYKEGKPWPVD